MKLIIDIPEQMYLNAKADMLCGAEVLVNAIKNGIPHENVTEFADRCRECGREKVLDKIRAEIAVLDDADYDYEGYYKAVTDAVKIIDKYKAESEDKK